MDFKQLMDLASQNKNRLKKQETKDATARNCDSKSNTSGVSDAAVKAFLAKRELERKRKAEEEKAARHAKIEERLAQSLGKEYAKDATCSQRQKKSSDSNVTARKHPDNKDEKQKVSEHKDSKTTCQTSSKKPDRTRHSSEPVTKNPDSNSKKSFSKGQGSMKRGAPMDFKALLAVAEKNKNGSAKLPPVFEHGQSVKQEGNKVEGGGATKGSLEQSKVVNRGQGKIVKDRKTTGQMHEKGSSKLQAKKVADKALSSVGDSKSRQDLKRSTGLMSGTASREKGLALKASSSANQRKLSSSKVVPPNNDRWPVKKRQLGKRRERDTLKRKRNPYMEDLDDMDDFIDDGDGDEVDVSKYIKEIFGYDRSRFHDDGGDDLAGMESSYKQIEREEVKSAKIARLEDEIEQLKELHELKKQRDQLKKKAKK